MKPIPKTSRESNRYIACKITAPQSITYVAFNEALEKTALEMVGKLGLGSLGIQVIKDQYNYPTAIIKTIAGQERLLRAILCAMTTIANSPIKVETTKTSGTINHVKL